MIAPIMPSSSSGLNAWYRRIPGHRVDGKTKDIVIRLHSSMAGNTVAYSAAALNLAIGTVSGPEPIGVLGVIAGSLLHQRDRDQLFVECLVLLEHDGAIGQRRHSGL